MRLITFVIVSVVAVLLSAEPARFDDYRILSVKIENDQQRKVLEELHSESVEVIADQGNGFVEIVVPPHKIASVNTILEKKAIKSEVKHMDLQELILKEQPAVKLNRFSWTQYHNYDVIYSWLDEKLREFPNILKSVVVGHSFENRTIRGVRLSHRKGNPVVLVDAAIHAREWIAPATVTFFLNELLTSGNSIIRNLAETIDWIIVPVLNVDGYSWSHTNFRMWRKTRQPHGKCIGADPNRNFDSYWGTVGSSNDPCSIFYKGPHPFSEPETLAMSRYMKGIQNLRMYLTFHAYGQYLLFPIGHRGPRVPNYRHLMRVGRKAARGIRRRFGTAYRVGPIATTLYPSSGGSEDWAYTNTNASLTYCLELPDRGHFGFILPAEKIVPTSLETVDGIVAMVGEARKLHYL